MDSPDTQDRTALLKTAYRKIAELRGQLATAQESHDEPVAIVGMGCRMPGGADDPEAFWQLLRNGVDGTTEIPADRWDVDELYDPDPEAPHKMYVRRGGFIDNFRRFDPLFFHVSPIEAACMDPQQRILLEVTWEALESAGWAPDRLAGSRTGVFVGTSGSDFTHMSLRAMQQDTARAHMATGISPSITAGHLSYFLGLRGPCMALDTACSSALTAIHMACTSLRNGEATAAIAGAVSLIISPEGNILVCKARMLAPDGHCKTFDAAADGYARSEGCGVVVLKLLKNAQADGDRILGVIRGSACNQDGRTNGITAPNGNAQREVIQAALAAARVTPAEIDYVETHGTGTSLGDPIEVQALGEVFGPGRAPDSKVTLGAVKSNIGHLECAAGMAAIIKTALVLQKAEIPPNLHFDLPNTLIPWDRLPFTVPTKPTPWQTNAATRKAGVSAFGFSGTNVHMILEEPPTPASKAVARDRGRHLLVLSGQTFEALADLAQRYVTFFDRTPDADPGDVCFTASIGRSHFAHRLAVAGNSIGELRDKLIGFLAAPEQDGDWSQETAPNRAPGLGLVIGSIPPSWGEALAAGSPVYRKAFEACEAAIRAIDPPLSGDEDAMAFARTYAATTQWLDWGLAPVAVTATGRHLLAAAAIAGAIGLEDALRLTRDPKAAVTWSTPKFPVLSPATGVPLAAEALLDALQTGAAIVADRLSEGLAREGGRVVAALGGGAFPAQHALDMIVFDGEGWHGILDGIGALHVAGVAIDWARFEAPWAHRRIALPTYPFQRQDCWLPIMSSGVKQQTTAPIAAPIHPLLDRRVHSAALQNDVVFESTFIADSPALLADHKFYSTIVVSMTTMLEMALAGGRIALGGDPLLEDIVVEQPLLVPERQTRLVQTVFTRKGDSFDFAILSADPATLNEYASWDRHCTGQVSKLVPSVHSTIDPDKLRDEYSQAVEPGWFYEMVSKSGVDYGPSFQALESISREGNVTFAKLRLPAPHAEAASAYAVHPGMLDAAIQAFGIGAALDAFDASDEQRDAYMPVGIERYSLTRPAGDAIWCRAIVRPSAMADPETFTGDVQLYDMAGAPIGELIGVLFKRNSRRQLAREVSERRLDSWLYEPRWERLADAAPKSVGVGQRWLVIGADIPLGKLLADRLHRAGATAILQEHTNYDALLQQVSASGRLDGIAYLAVNEDNDETIGLAKDKALDLLDLVQALQREGVTELANFALVTRGFKTPSVADAGALAGGTVWGMGRVVTSEFPDLNCRLYDLDPALAVEDAIDHLTAELVDPSKENQIALDRTDRFALRLMRLAPSGIETHKLTTGAVQLDIGGRGDFRQLRFVPQEPAGPARNEVQLRVLATAMNFRDVLNVLGMYPGDPGEPGVECVGEVIALGEGVEGVAIGDHVLAIPHKGYATYANAPINMVFKRPENLSLAECATLLVAYLTATYALNHLGKMGRGERVLIHAGAGGVGLAAIQLAQRAGAEVFATAGSPAKRDYLRRIGVKHVLDSRSIDFAEQIRAITGGDGVDLVLNSLTGPAMELSLLLLRAGGRFLEIGRTDVYTPEQARAINPRASHDVIELLAPFQDSADMMQALFDDIRDGLATGDLRPLPYKIFGLDETTEAFRYMSAARHIGKVIVIDRTAEAYRPIEPTGTYMVTGGLGGLGLACARWLARQGAKSIILVSRRSPGPGERAAIEAIEAEGATVDVAQADIGNREQLAELLARFVSPSRPLRGILHSAGLIDDGIITSQDHRRFETVMRPKVDGGWLLHELTLKSPLEFFVLFSSGAGLFGNPGQSSYAAASVFLDELARARQNAGLPALSIDWGPWAEIGMAARLDKRHTKDWDAQGLGSIAPDDGLTILQKLLRLDRHDQVAVLPFDPATLARSANQTLPLLSRLVEKRSEATTAASPAMAENAAARFHDAASDQKPAVLVEIITELVVDVFGLDPSRTLSPDQNLTEIGMDSLMAIQLSNRLKAAFLVGMPATLAFQRPTVQEISHYVLEKMPTDATGSADIAETPAASKNDPNAEQLLANLGDLNDDDVEALLAELETRARPA